MDTNDRDLLEYNGFLLEEKGVKLRRITSWTLAFSNISGKINQYKLLSKMLTCAKSVDRWDLLDVMISIFLYVFNIILTNCKTYTGVR